MVDYNTIAKFFDFLKSTEHVEPTGHELAQLNNFKMVNELFPEASEKLSRYDMAFDINTTIHLGTSEQGRGPWTLSLPYIPDGLTTSSTIHLFEGDNIIQDNVTCNDLINGQIRNPKSLLIGDNFTCNEMQIHDISSVRIGFGMDTWKFVAASCKIEEIGSIKASNIRFLYCDFSNYFPEVIAGSLHTDVVNRAGLMYISGCNFGSIPLHERGPFPDIKINRLYIDEDDPAILEKYKSVFPNVGIIRHYKFG